MYSTVVCIQVHLVCPVVKDMCRNYHVSNCSTSTGPFDVSYKYWNYNVSNYRKCACLHRVSYIFRTCAVQNHVHNTVLIPEIYVVYVLNAHVLCY